MVRSSFSAFTRYYFNDNIMPLWERDEAFVFVFFPLAHSQCFNVMLAVPLNYKI